MISTSLKLNVSFKVFTVQCIVHKAASSGAEIM